jgi:type VI secretion system protein ImpM
VSFGALDEDSGVAAFVFGKLPAHGDFISRGLDDEAIEAADAALAEAITIAALHWSDRWDDVYVETPVWRFIAAPGVLGREWTAGVFMASVDAVGRQFPLLAGFSAASLALVARGAALTAALNEAEALARKALIEGESVDTLLSAFEGASRHFAPPLGGDPGEAFAAAALLQGQSSNWSQEGIFWVAGAESLTPVRVSGPLAGEALSALFQPAPVPPEEPAQVEPEPAPAPVETPAMAVCDKDSPPAESVVSSSPPADAA